jgi:hypothetical protein
MASSVCRSEAPAADLRCSDWETRSMPCRASGCVYSRIAAPVTTTILDVPSRILLDLSAKVACIYGLPQGSVAS